MQDMSSGKAQQANMNENSEVKAVKSARSQDWELFKTLLAAFFIALVFRSFAYEPFHIPSGSMKNTLLVGDYLFVSKYSYGYSQYSLPLSLPLFEGRVLDSMPERGDVVVFRPVGQESVDYIKRIVGLPGDRMQVKSGVLFINDKAVEREATEDFTDIDPKGNRKVIRRYRETLPNGVSYDTLDLMPHGDLDNTQVYEVPKGHFFMMGDNRDSSSDSRVLGSVGYVPYENLVGKAQFIFLSSNGSARFWEVWKWPAAIRWERTFSSVE